MAIEKDVFHLLSKQRDGAICVGTIIKQTGFYIQEIEHAIMNLAQSCIHLIHPTIYTQFYADSLILFCLLQKHFFQITMETN